MSELLVISSDCLWQCAVQIFTRNIWFCYHGIFSILAIFVIKNCLVVQKYLLVHSITVCQPPRGVWSTAEFSRQWSGSLAPALAAARSVSPEVPPEPSTRLVLSRSFSAQKSWKPFCEGQLPAGKPGLQPFILGSVILFNWKKNPQLDKRV